MLNLLGDLWFREGAKTASEPDWAAVLALPGAHLHLYGKREARVGRKMGHLNITAATPEAARAVSCALPFIAGAEQVTILTVLDDADAKDESGGRLLRALRWHNKAVQVRTPLRGSASAADVLHREAEALGADLLVMGGYSHSRLREVVFGGFTRRTLGNAGIPVLMAH
jgi:nucleotide-binding universal stress UspA family protein